MYRASLVTTTYRLDRPLIGPPDGTAPWVEWHATPAGSTPPPPDPAPDRAWRSTATLGVTEAAAVLGIGEDAVREAIRLDQIPHLRFGRKVRIPVPALRRLLGEEVV